MGGRNSGYYQRASSISLTTDYLSLDIRTFKKRGWLNFPSNQTLTWSKNGNAIGSINYVLNKDEIKLNYRTRANGGEWEDIVEAIAIATTSCNFGGNRKWFKCPKCSMNVLVLYSDKSFQCRKCHGLIHPSVNESKLDRASRAVERYQSVLSPDSQVTVLDGLEWLPKPKWMRYSTYYRLRSAGMVKQREMCQRMIDSFGVSYL
jgi:ribosomal protein S27AE